MNLQLVTPDFEQNAFDIENTIQAYDQLGREIKTLESMRDVMKKKLIEKHFHNNETFVSKKGIILATYKPQIRSTFKTTDFKREHEKLYEFFTEDKIIYTLVIK